MKIKAETTFNGKTLIWWLKSATPALDGKVDYTWTDYSHEAFEGTELEMCALRRLMEVCNKGKEINWDYTFDD